MNRITHLRRRPSGPNVRDPRTTIMPELVGRLLGFIDRAQNPAVDAIVAVEALLDLDAEVAIEPVAPVEAEEAAPASRPPMRPGTTEGERIAEHLFNLRRGDDEPAPAPVTALPLARLRLGVATSTPPIRRTSDIEKLSAALAWLRSHGVSVSSAGLAKWWVSGGYAEPFGPLELVALARKKGFDA